MNGGSPEYELSMELKDITNLSNSAELFLTDPNQPFWAYTGPTEMMTLTRQGDEASFLTISGDEMLVEINLQTGEHKFGENYTPTKAAETFWTAMGQVHVSAASQLAECRDVINKAREVLGVRSEDSLVGIAKARMDHIEWLRRRNDELGLKLRLMGDNPEGRLTPNIDKIDAPAQTRLPILEITASPREFVKAIAITRTFTPQKVQSKMNFDDAMKVVKDL